MILNVSSRTDVVAFYSDWFMNRYKEGFVDVRNPFYPKLVSRIYFDDVDLIVFCSKNPIPILKYLKEIDKPIIFHVTLTCYGRDIEPNVLPKGKVINAIKELSKMIDINNLYVRYDPILLNDKYTVDYHIKAFESLCSKLSGYVKKIIVSFVDDYKNVRNNINILRLKKVTMNDMKIIGEEFSRIASFYGMSVQTCNEKNDLSQYGFISSVCLSKEYAFKLTGKKFPRWRAFNCGCVQMVDIGEYNSCMHMCRYCYANYDERVVFSNYKMHDDKSSLLVGHIQDEDIIKVRK